MPSANPTLPEMQAPVITVQPYDPRFRDAFRDLNLAWLEKYFTVEPVHLKVLEDPEGQIIQPGGEIFFAVRDGVPVGTVAVRNEGGGAYELTKLGVDPSAQGLGLGRRLTEAVIRWYHARANRTRLFLETHTKLKPAMHLYEELGFVLTDNPGADEYEGTDCYMEWRPDAGPITVAPATVPEDFVTAKSIFRAFSEWLPIDLGFQDFESEMKRFPEGFVLVLVAKRAGLPLGAVALKPHPNKVCEMKRLFVLPEAHGLGLGRKLCERLLSEAKSMGYTTMLLDSLGRLVAAVALYKKLGFKDTEPYNFNPEADVVYMRRSLEDL